MLFSVNKIIRNILSWKTSLCILFFYFFTLNVISSFIQSFLITKFYFCENFFLFCCKKFFNLFFLWYFFLLNFFFCKLDFFFDFVPIQYLYWRFFFADFLFLCNFLCIYLLWNFFATIFLHKKNILILNNFFFEYFFYSCT